jgi:hypothetical protein
VQRPSAPLRADEDAGGNRGISISPFALKGMAKQLPLEGAVARRQLEE